MYENEGIMKKITKIEYQKKNKDRFNVYLDGEYGFSLDMDILLQYSLEKNMELSLELIDDILEAEERISVYNYGIYILARRAKSEYEIRLKMEEKGFHPPLIDNAIEKLKEKKYLDDEKYCQLFINYKINNNDGILKIKNALYHKGIDRKIIEEKIRDISPEDEEARAIIVGRKKLSSLRDEDKRKRMVKLSNYLLGKGFQYHVVIKAVEKLLNTEFENY